MKRDEEINFTKVLKKLVGSEVMLVIPRSDSVRVLNKPTCSRETPKAIIKP